MFDIVCFIFLLVFIVTGIGYILNKIWNQVIQQGRDDFDKGLPASANPHIGEDALSRAWIQGWRERYNEKHEKSS